MLLSFSQAFETAIPHPAASSMEISLPLSPMAIISSRIIPSFSARLMRAFPFPVLSEKISISAYNAYSHDIRKPCRAFLCFLNGSEKHTNTFSTVKLICFHIEIGYIFGKYKQTMDIFGNSVFPMLSGKPCISIALPVCMYNGLSVCRKHYIKNLFKF